MFDKMESTVRIAFTKVEPKEAEALFNESIMGRIDKLEKNLKKNVWMSAIVPNPKSAIKRIIEKGKSCALRVSKFSSADEMISLLSFLNQSTHETFVSVSIAQSDGSIYVLIADKNLSKRLRREFPENRPLMEDFGPAIN